MAWRRAAVGAVAAALLAACGTTVPLGSTAPPAGPDGLGTLPPSTPAGGTGGDGGTLPSAAAGSTGAGSPTFPGTAGARGGSSGRAGTGTTPPVVDRSPLTVGLTYINNDQTSAALGVSDSTTASKQNVVRALVRGLNARGGVGGRPLKVVEYEWNSQSSNWSVDASAACTRFTQDHKVAVVLDNAFGTIGGFRDCLQKKGVLSLQNAPEGDDLSSRAARLHANTYNLTTDRTYVAVLDGLAATGYLKRSSKVGVIVESCVETQRAWTRSVRPRLTQLVAAAPQESTLGCTRGFADAGPAASAVSNDVLRFRSAGVDRVLFVSDNESVLLLLFASAAGSQGYTPGYLLSSGAQAQSLRSQLPASQQPQLHGVGQLPLGDTDGAPLRPVDRECLTMARAGGVQAASYADYGIVAFECGPLLLLDAALRSTGGTATATALSTAVAALGSAFQAPGLVSGATTYGPSRHDGPSRLRVFGYVASCGCMRYSGPPRPAPR